MKLTPSGRECSTQEVGQLCANLRRLGYSEPEIIHVLMLWRIIVH